MEKYMGLGEFSTRTCALNGMEKGCLGLHPRKVISGGPGRYGCVGKEEGRGSCHNFISIIKGKSVASGNEKKVTARWQVSP